MSGQWWVELDAVRSYVKSLHETEVTEAPPWIFSGRKSNAEMCKRFGLKLYVHPLHTNLLNLDGIPIALQWLGLDRAITNINNLKNT